MEIQLINQAFEKKKQQITRLNKQGNPKHILISIQMPALYSFNPTKKIMKLTKQAAFFSLFFKN